MISQKISFFILLIISLLLAGCTFKAKQPLLASQDTVLPFGKSLMVAKLNDHGGLISKKGETVAIVADAKNGTYFSRHNSKTSFRLIEVDHPNFQYLGEMGENGEYTYVGVTLKDGQLLASLVAMASDKSKDFVAREPGVKKAGNYLEVSDVETLLRAVKMAAQYPHAKSQKQSIVLRYKVATTKDEMDSLAIRIAGERCLAKAGHALDEAMQTMPPKLRKGFFLTQIDVKAAKPACEPFANPGFVNLFPSASYSASRVYRQSGELDKSQALVDALLKEEFWLAYIARADDMINGSGREKDIAGTRKFLQAAMKRHPQIGSIHGHFLEIGTYGSTDLPAAVAAFKIAAEHDVAFAQFRLSLLLVDGKGTKRNRAKATAWLRRAAKNGLGDAQNRLAENYYFGRNAVKDLAKSYEWHKKAAENGNAGSQYATGFMLLRGQGVKKNPTLALTQLKKAVAQDHSAAEGEYGRILYYGQSVKADRQKGRALLEKAAKSGDKNAKDYLKSIGNSDLPAVSDKVSNNIKNDLQRMAEGKPFKLTETNLQFMGGVAQRFIAECKGSIPNKDRLEIVGLAGNSGLGLLGFDYSNPDIGKAIGSMGKAALMSSAGAEFAKQIPCGSSTMTRLVSALADASRSNRGGGSSGPAPFVQSCSRAFNETKCKCIAQMGRSAIPNIYQRQYSRSLMKEIISRNPIAALALATTCGVGQY